MGKSGSPLVVKLKRAAPAAQFLMYVGTYTGKGSKGIYLYRFDAASGKLQAVGVAAELGNPTFLAIHPQRRFLYAVGEARGGSVNAFAIKPGTGALTFLNRQSSRGAGPCHVSVDRTGRFALVANYSPRAWPSSRSMTTAPSARRRTGSSTRGRSAIASSREARMRTRSRSRRTIGSRWRRTSGWTASSLSARPRGRAPAAERSALGGAQAGRGAAPP